VSHICQKESCIQVLEKKHVSKYTKTMMNIIFYCDGQHSINDISHILKIKEKHVLQILKKLMKFKLIKELECYNN
jgi:aminopeptidase-like protein